MQFTVLDSNSKVVSSPPGTAVLLRDNWNDWFKFRTLFVLFITDEFGETHRIGEVKIGAKKNLDEFGQTILDEKFNTLSSDYFSLGQDASYYENINKFGDAWREPILKSLNDIALDEKIFEDALAEDVTAESLLRYVPRTTVLSQFRRMARGGARVTSYRFKYTLPLRPKAEVAPTLEFSVIPESMPPSNVHVLIGRNGVGKTYALEAMTRCLAVQDQSAGSFTFGDEWDFEAPEEYEFATLISVTFSAFDPFEPLPIRRDQSKGLQYHYIGLKYQTRADDGSQRPPKDPKMLAGDFATSVYAILRQAPMRDRWVNAVKLLESDPIFARAEAWRLSEIYLDETEEVPEDEQADEVIRKHVRKRSLEVFEKLSSGHKIVLLTITRLVETVVEKSLVLLDEPEAHLHPPLLSAFTRSLSNLLINRNAVAIIATHSPVILQEVPSSCVWKLRASGHQAVADRPNIETFGENVGLLTHEVFGLEVTSAGFYSLIEKQAEQAQSYDELIARFEGRLGTEGRALARAIWKSRVA